MIPAPNVGWCTNVLCLLLTLINGQKSNQTLQTRVSKSRKKILEKLNFFRENLPTLNIKIYIWSFGKIWATTFCENLHANKPSPTISTLSTKKSPIQSYCLTYMFSWYKSELRAMPAKSHPPLPPNPTHRTTIRSWKIMPHC